MKDKSGNERQGGSPNMWEESFSVMCSVGQRFVSWKREEVIIRVVRIKFAELEIKCQF